MPCTAVHMKRPVQGWRGLGVCALVMRHLPRRAVEPSAVGPLGSFDRVGGKANGGKGRDDGTMSNRKRKALLFFQRQGCGGGKGKGAGSRSGFRP